MVFKDTPETAILEYGTDASRQKRVRKHPCGLGLFSSFRELESRCVAEPKGDSVFRFVPSPQLGAGSDLGVGTATGRGAEDVPCAWHGKPNRAALPANSHSRRQRASVIPGLRDRASSVTAGMTDCCPTSHHKALEGTNAVPAHWESWRRGAEPPGKTPGGGLSRPLKQYQQFT